MDYLLLNKNSSRNPLMNPVPNIKLLLETQAFISGKQLYNSLVLLMKWTMKLQPRFWNFLAKRRITSLNGLPSKAY